MRRSGAPRSGSAGERKDMGRFTWKPAPAAEWDDLAALFGPRGACGGCWCMWWRVSRRDFARLKGDGTRRALKRLPRPGRGVPRRLVSAAVWYAASRGARIVEAYPTDSRAGQPDAFVYTGLASAFTSGGFVEGARRAQRRA